MNLIHLPSGVAPAIAWSPAGWWVAVGDSRTSSGLPCVSLYLLAEDGFQISRQDFPDGFGFPVITSAFLAYKGGDSAGYKAILRPLYDLGTSNQFDPAGGNFPLALDDRYFAWQTTNNYRIFRVLLQDLKGPQSVLGYGAPDGLAWLTTDGEAVLRKDVAHAIPGLLNPQRAPFQFTSGIAQFVYVGEQPDLAPQWPLGLTVAFSNAPGLHWLLGGQDCSNPKIACSPDGERIGIVCWGAGDSGVRVILAERQELLELSGPPGNIPPLQPLHVPAISRPCWLGFFLFGGVDVGPSLANCWLTVSDLLVQCDQGYLGQYVAAEADGTLSGLNLAIQIARARSPRPSLPILAYWPKDLQQGVRPTGAIPAIEAYHRTVESLVQWEQDLRAVISRCDQCWLVCQGYTQPQPSSLTTDLRSLVPIYAALARDFPQILGLLVFSAGSRAGGWNDHLEIHEVWEDLAGGIVGAPEFPVVPPAVPPPTPPTPPSPIPDPFPSAIPYEVRMESQKAKLAGSAGRFVRVDESRPTSGIFDGIALEWSDDPNDPACQFTVTDLGGGKFMAVPDVRPDLFLGGDNTQYSGDLSRQLYLIDHREGNETFTGVRLRKDAEPILLIEHFNDGKYFCTVPLTVVPA